MPEGRPGFRRRENADGLGPPRTLGYAARSSPKPPWPAPLERWSLQVPRQTNLRTRRATLFAGLFCASMAIGIAHAQLACTADFSALGQAQQTVTIVFKSEGTFDAFVNGVSSHIDGQVSDEPIRRDLDWSADPYGATFASFNGAERSLVHLHRVLAIPHRPDAIQIPFALSAVRRMRTFDLAGKSDKFGGHVLLEAYDEHNTLLGRVVRRILVAACR